MRFPANERGPHVPAATPGTTIDTSMPRKALQRGRVVVLASPDRDSAHHESVTQRHLAREAAALLGYAYGGVHEGGPLDWPSYAVPQRTLLVDEALALGIHSDADLLGGVVPHAFVAGKAITHGLVAREAAAPAGWAYELARGLDGAVLDGYSAFSREDARIAARRLLARGPVRLKAASACGGRGQAVCATFDAFEAALATITAGDLDVLGIVVERDLVDARTYSIGTIRVGASRISYFGHQRGAVDHLGRTVYGGSDLVAVRGDFDALSTVGMPVVAAAALAKAIHYDAAVAAAYPAFYASRRNYDVVHGRDADGLPHIGVLEQSWRIGGASAAELLALRAFAADPHLACVRVSTHEEYAGGAPPEGATVYFTDRSGRFGGLVKYARTHGDGYPA